MELGNFLKAIDQVDIKQASKKVEKGHEIDPNDPKAKRFLEELKKEV